MERTSNRMTDDDSMAWLQLIEGDGEQGMTESESEWGPNNPHGWGPAHMSDQAALRSAFLQAVLSNPEDHPGGGAQHSQVPGVPQLPGPQRPLPWFVRVEKVATLVAVKLERGRDGLAQALATATGSVR